jgi:hypothetical protein
MNAEWQYQIRIYLINDELAILARTDIGAPPLQPLANVLAAHNATLVSQFDAFAGYVAEAEREGIDKCPLYRWTKAAIEDPAKRLNHMKAFALHVSGQEVYRKPIADALDVALRPLLGSELVERLSRHDTNPDNNLAIPAEYRW